MQRIASHVSFVLVALLSLSACRQPTSESITIGRKATVLTDQQIRNLNRQRVFFGHQSVGDNIVQGIRDVMAADSRLKINLVSSADPQSVAVDGSAFIETHIGVNRNPQSKNDAFAAMLEKGFGAQGGVALYKYCYIDFNPATDVQQVFDRYRDAIAGLKQKHPSLTIVHATVPLTADESSSGLSTQIRTSLRRILGRDPNIKRNQFNQLLIQTYGGKDPIFDIAEVESTHADGSRSYFLRGFAKIYTLASEFTTDGGHLNEAGRRAAAERLLSVLAGIPTQNARNYPASSHLRPISDLVTREP